MAGWVSGSTIHEEAFGELVEWWEDLVDGRGSHVVLVRAPSGWGRSTLLGRLGRHVRRHAEPVRVLEVPTGRLAAARLGPGVQAEWLAGLLEPDFQPRCRELTGVNRLAGQLNLGLGLSGLFLQGLPTLAALLLAATGISAAETAWDQSVAGPPSRAARLASVIARVSRGIPVVVLIDDADELAPDLATAMVRRLVERIDSQVLVVLVVDPTSSQLADQLRTLERDALLSGRVHALDLESDMNEPDRLTLINRLVADWPPAAKSRLAARAQTFAEVFKVLALDGAASLGAVLDEGEAIQRLDKLVSAAGWGRARSAPSWPALAVAWAGGLLHREQLARMLTALSRPAELGKDVVTIGPWVRLADPGALSEVCSEAHGHINHLHVDVGRVIVETAAELVADPDIDMLSRIGGLRPVEHLVAAKLTRLQVGEVGLLVTLARDLAQLGDTNDAKRVAEIGFQAASDAEDHDATASLYALRLQLDRQDPDTHSQARILADEVHAGIDATVGLEARVWATVVRLDDPMTQSTAVEEVEALADELDQHVGPIATWWRLLLSYYVGRAGHPAVSQDLLAPVLVTGSSEEDRQTAEWILYAIGGPHADMRLYLIALQAEHTRLTPDAPDEERLRLEAAIAHTNAKLHRYATACEHAKHQLRLLTNVAGADHVDTILTRSNIANWTGLSGDFDEARRLCSELLADVTRILGADNANTLATRSNLAHWIGEAGDFAEARRLYAELFRDEMRVLGADHPITLNALNNLAGRTRDMGDVGEARRLSAALLSARVRVLGADHPDTVATLNNLAALAGEAGDVSEARRLYAELLPYVTRTLGADHPNVFATRGSTAHWTGEAGEVGEARRLYAELLADEMRVLGADHPSTLTTRGNIARWTAEAHEIENASSLYSELLPDMIRVLGANHPHTRMVRNSLERCIQMTGG